MSKEIIDIAIFGLLLGAAVLAAIKLRGASRGSYIAIAGFALLSAVYGLRLVDHFALETLGARNSGLVVLVDALLTLFGLALILRGMSAWKKEKDRGAVVKNGSQASYKKLHRISLDIARRIESVAGAESSKAQTRVSALEALFEACGENLSGALRYDGLTVELAPLDGTTAHAITRDTGAGPGTGTGAVRTHFYPVRQSLAQVCGTRHAVLRLIRKSSFAADSACWVRLGMTDVKEALLSEITFDCGFSLTIAVVSRSSDRFDEEQQFLLSEFLKLIRPLALVTLNQAAHIERREESPAANGIEWRPAAGVSAAGVSAAGVESRLRIRDGVASSPVPGTADGSDRT